MKTFKNKTIAISIAIILTISMSASIMLIPPAAKHIRHPTTLFPTPTLLLLLNLWGLVNQCQFPSGSTILFQAQHNVLSNIRRTNYYLNITAPDGISTTQTFATIADPTGIKTIFYTPTQVGNYKFDFYYAGQTYIWNSVNTPDLHHNMQHIKTTLFQLQVQH